MQNNEQDFFDKYTCIDNPFTENGNYENRIFEDYRSSSEEIIAIENARKNGTVWTLIDNNNGWVGVIAGWHHINRCGYFITEEPYESLEEEYTFYDTTELREQWEKLPIEALEEVIGGGMDHLSEEDIEEIRDDNFFVWEEMDELERDKIMKQYGI